MKTCCDKVLETIKQKSIKPFPRWYFFARDCALWFLASLATILGGIAFSLVMLFVYFQRFGINHPRPADNLHWLLVSIPYAWLTVFVLLIFVIYYNLKHLKKSYKYPAYLLIIASLFGSIVLGVTISRLGIHRQMNSEFSRHLPFYGPMFDARRPAWDRPNEGFLAGKIKLTGDDFMVIEDFNQQEWRVIFHEETKDEESVQMIPGQAVMISGFPDGPRVFLADEIFPWEGCRKKCKLIKPEPSRRPLDIQ